MKMPQQIDDALQDIRLCNCAECGCELLGVNQPPSVRPLLDKLSAVTPTVAGRIKGRPYCDTCLGTEPTGNHGSWERFDSERHDSVYHGKTTGA